MDEAEVFRCLFKTAKTSKDPEGVVAACIVLKGEIKAVSASADDGIRHAEDLVIEKAVGNKGIKIDDEAVLYTTLEPCSMRSRSNKVPDCTTIIINSGIKNVVYAAVDPEFSKNAENRFQSAGVNYRQIRNKKIIEQAVKLFNSTIRVPLQEMQLPRERKIPSE